MHSPNKFPIKTAAASPSEFVKVNPGRRHLRNLRPHPNKLQCKAEDDYDTPGHSQSHFINQPPGINNLPLAVSFCNLHGRSLEIPLAMLLGLLLCAQESPSFCVVNTF